jgi:large conductance mechanosensitive channel
VLKGFKDFILRGNVVELAVAVVIGGAFTALVAVFGEAVINPLIAVIGGPDADGLGFQILADNEATFVNVGAVITAIIAFLITAAVVYFFVVVPMNKLADRREAQLDVEPEPEEVEADVALLTEIRDLLARQDQPPASQG